MRLTWDSWAPTSKGELGSLSLSARWCSPKSWGVRKGTEEQGWSNWSHHRELSGSHCPWREVDWPQDMSEDGMRIGGGQGCRFQLDLSQHFWSTNYLNVEWADCWGDELSVPGGLKLSTWAPQHLGMCLETWLSTYSLHLVNDSVHSLDHASHMDPTNFLIPGPPNSLTLGTPILLTQS